MRINTLQEMEQYVQDYLSGNAEMDSQEENSLQSVAESLVEFFRRQSDATQQILIFSSLSRLLQCNNDNIDARRKALKVTLSRQQAQPWKDSVFNVKTKNIFNIYSTSLQYDNDANIEVCYNENRFTQQISSDGLHVAILGSNFVTTIPAKHHAEPSQVLDSLYAAYKVKANNLADVIIALGDGCGGHYRVNEQYFANPRLTEEERATLVATTNKDFRIQDHNIARASHFATKHATRLFSLYKEPDDLLASIPEVINDVEREIKQKAGTEATTLVCARAFQLCNGYRVVGFNIGDSMLAAWVPSELRFINLAPSIVSIPFESQETTAQIPEQYKPFEVHVIDQIVPSGAILIALSDGFINYMPQVVQNKVYPNDMPYKEVTLDENIMREILATELPKEASANDYMTYLTRYVINKTNETRDRLTEGVAGDDLSLVALNLNVQSIAKVTKVGICNLL